jgi:hypothetical protein
MIKKLDISVSQPFPHQVELDLMNAKFHVIQIGGKARVLMFVKTPTGGNDQFREMVTFMSFADFKQLHDVKKIKITITRGNGKEAEVRRGIGSWWLDQEQRDQYGGLVFLPGKDKVIGTGDNRHFNLWRGFGVTPRAGKWLLLRLHIEMVLAKGNKANATYIINWVAWAIQHPGEQAETVLVLQGKKGTGKGLLGRLMCRIFGHHGLHISSREQLIGSFNGHFADCALLFADEAYWPGDKASEGVLQALVTEPTIPLQKKYQDTIQIKNNLHIIMASDKDWVVPAGMDERRYAIFDTSTVHMQKRDYFDPLYAEIENGGAEAFLYDLLHMDLDDWHPRYDIPQTQALKDQKDLTLSPADQWWFELISSGVLPHTIDDKHGTIIVETNRPDQASSQALFEHARKTVPRLKNESDHTLGRILKNKKCSNLNVRMPNKGGRG